MPHDRHIHVCVCVYIYICIQSLCLNREYKQPKHVPCTLLQWSKVINADSDIQRCSSISRAICISLLFYGHCFSVSGWTPRRIWIVKPPKGNQSEKGWGDWRHISFTCSVDLLHQKTRRSKSHVRGLLGLLGNTWLCPAGLSLVLTFTTVLFGTVLYPEKLTWGRDAANQFLAPVSYRDAQMTVPVQAQGTGESRMTHHVCQATA